ncbi:MFS transporter [Pseudomonas sp. NPDC007930]|uniref:MFS transporter n=1 Tax=Pseudomonas sp. NPDC007930 TaxID=3364417 RepID=UPI0036E11065
MNRLPLRTWLYFSAQSINLTTAVMSVTMAAAVGAALAPAVGWATVPYGVQFLAMLLVTYPAAAVMRRVGRRAGFLLGAAALAVAGVCGYLAVGRASFPGLILSHGALGVYIAFANYNRFAATDGLPAPLRPRALSLVVAGGVVAAVAGPLLVQGLRVVAGEVDFALCYLAFIGLAAGAALIAWRLPANPVAPASSGDTGGTFAQAPSARVYGTILLAALGYGVMNLLMVQASLQMAHQHQGFEQVRLAIQWHVLAMFVPSFFAGRLIQRFGSQAIASAGLVLLMATALLNLLAQGYEAMAAALVLLGIGWNFTYVGGGALLAGMFPEGIGHRWQGINDTTIGLFAAAGAFLPSLLMAQVGWWHTNLGCVVIIAAVLLARGIGQCRVLIRAIRQPQA